MNKYKKSLLVVFLLKSTIYNAIAATNESSDTQSYHLIKALLDQYQRPFTLLEIDAELDCCALQIAQNQTYTNSVIVMSSLDQQLLDHCKNNSYENLILLNQQLGSKEILHLSECEHFDVVIASNIWQKFGTNWKIAMEEILKLGDFMIIAAPISCPEIKNYALSKQGQILGSINYGKNQIFEIYLIRSSNNFLKRKTWLRMVMDNDLYQIESSFINKKLIKPVSFPKGAKQASNWVPGINLCTFKMCHGVYPAVKQLKASLNKIKQIPHSDWLINNMILQGNKIALIDCDDESCKAFFCDDLLQAHEEILELDNPQKVEHYFWYKLIKVPVARRHVLKLFSQLFPPSSLVFEINTYAKDDIEPLLNHYLSYGSKVIYYNPDLNHSAKLRKKSQQENLFLTNSDLLRQKTNHDAIIDSMIMLYGMPTFCNINTEPEAVYDFLKSMSQPVPSIAFKFNIKNQTDLNQCLDYLKTLGYMEFNFTVRDLPGLILDNNRYINRYKTWAKSIDELLHEINEFTKLDHDNENLWGYIYAHHCIRE